MEEPIIAGVADDLSEAKITVVGVPDVPGKAAEIFKIVAKTGANVDMIVQNVSAASTGRTDISFTLPEGRRRAALTALATSRTAVGFESLQYDDQIGKLSLVGAGMRTTPGVSATLFEALYDAGMLALQHLGDLAADSDHLVTVVRVQDRVHVRLHPVEDREVVAGERADTARPRVLVEGAAPSKRVIGARERRTTCRGTTGRRPWWRGRVELDVAVDGQRRRAALDAVAVALEVDAPELVRDELTVVRVERRVGVEMDHRGAPPSVVANTSGSTVISPSWRFQYVHIGRSGHLAGRSADVDPLGQPEQRPEPLRPRAGRDTTCSPTSIGRRWSRSRRRCRRPGR